MSFGLNQIGKPTPATVTWIFRIVLYVGLALILVTSSYPQIPPDVKELINSTSALLIGLTHLASRMFGVTLPDDAKVSAKDVAALNTDKPDTK